MKLKHRKQFSRHLQLEERRLLSTSIVMEVDDTTGEEHFYEVWKGADGTAVKKEVSFEQAQADFATLHGAHHLNLVTEEASVPSVEAEVPAAIEEAVTTEEVVVAEEAAPVTTEEEVAPVVTEEASVPAVEVEVPVAIEEAVTTEEVVVAEEAAPVATEEVVVATDASSEAPVAIEEEVVAVIEEVAPVPHKEGVYHVAIDFDFDGDGKNDVLTVSKLGANIYEIHNLILSHDGSLYGWNCMGAYLRPDPNSIAAAEAAPAA